MSRWYRAYEGTVTDAKLHEAAMVAGVSRSVAIATWHAILEACAAAKSARYDTTPRRIAVILGEPLSAIEGVFAALVELGMIADGEATAWAKRQFDSDNSTERSRKHREARRNADATLQGRSETPPDTDTDTETEGSSLRSEPKSSLRSDSACAAPAAAVPKISSEEAAKRRLLALGVPKDLLSDFLRVRKAHKAPLTDNAVLGLIREFEAAGLTETEGIRLCVERNWRGFRAEFLTDKPPNKRPQNAH